MVGGSLTDSLKSFGRMDSRVNIAAKRVYVSSDESRTRPDEGRCYSERFVDTKKQSVEEAAGYDIAGVSRDVFGIASIPESVLLEVDERTRRNRQSETLTTAGSNGLTTEKELSEPTIVWRIFLGFWRQPCESELQVEEVGEWESEDGRRK